MRHLIPLLAVISMNLAVLPALAEAPQIGGYLRQHTSVLPESGDFALIQNTFNLNVEHSLGKAAFLVNPYVYQTPGEDLELGLRQAYIDLYWRSVDLRIGRQQIVWGKADGVFITDLVSPKDLRRFLLPDFEEIRIGVDAVKLNCYRATSTLEFVWIPVFTPTRLPESGSIWEKTPTFPVPASFDLSSKEVDESLENSEVFGKYSLLSSAIDFELMAGYAWNDDPTFHLVPQFDQETGEPDSLVVRPEHHRLTLAGGSFSTEFGGFVFRGEGAFYRGKCFSTEDPFPDDGVLERDSVHYLFGIDRSLLGLRMSAQFSRETILDYDDRLAEEQDTDVMTYLVSNDYLNETLHIELFSYIGLTHGDALVRSKISYDMADGLEVLFGADLFSGKDGMFGVYHENDLVYAKIKYSF